MTPQPHRSAFGRAIIAGAMLALSAQAFAADLPLKPAPARPAVPSAASPSGVTAACLEWTDGCRVCQRAAGGEVSCSNVGIACVQKADQCTRR